MFSQTCQVHFFNKIISFIIIEPGVTSFINSIVNGGGGGGAYIIYKSHGFFIGPFATS